MSTKIKYQVPEFDADAEGLFGEPNTTGTPERNMLMAILERAILDYVGNDRLQMESAQDWIFSGDSDLQYEDWSFPWVCDQLDLDPLMVATTIAGMPKRGARRIAPWYFARQASA